MGDYIGPNMGSIIQVMKLMNVENQKEVFLKVLECFKTEEEVRNRGKQDAR